MKSIVKIALGIILAFILIIGGCTAMIGGAMDDPSTPQDKAAEIIDEANSEEPAASEEPSEEPAEEPAEKPTEKPEPQMTTAQANAVRTAESYLSMSGFSEKSLTEQLAFEGYSKADAKFAIKALRPNWKKEAAQSAESYVEMSGFSRSGLIEQLMFEGYTRQQAEYGATKAGL
jgi:hypothetical protein